MKLNPKQLAELIELTVTTRLDEIGCDGCCELMDQLAQAELDGTTLSDSLEAISEHVNQCKCCRDEYLALMTALKEIQ
jgi:hypothetical protein